MDTVPDILGHDDLMSPWTTSRWLLSDKKTGTSVLFINYFISAVYMRLISFEKYFNDNFKIAITKH